MKQTLIELKEIQTDAQLQLETSCPSQQSMEQLDRKSTKNSPKTSNNITDIYRILHTTHLQNTRFFSIAHRAYTKIDHILST